MAHNNNKKNLWSHDIDAQWHPKEGFFDQSAEKIAQELKDASNSLGQAMDRLNFYINRAGDKLSKERKNVLEKSKKLLDGLYKK